MKYMLIVLLLIVTLANVFAWSINTTIALMLAFLVIHREPNTPSATCPDRCANS